MPTENRSSNTEMVSVPRELAERIQQRLNYAASAFKAAKPERDELRAILAQPAEQHQVEPVPVLYYKALFGAECKPNGDAYSVVFVPMPGHQPLYTHADPGEVERLREARKFLNWPRHPLPEKIDAAISASAEPSALIADPCRWSDQQVMDFLGVALRNVDLQGEVRLSEIRQGFQFMRDRGAL